MKPAAVLAAMFVASSLVPAPAVAHAERPVEFPSGAGSVPVYRADGTALVVCKPDSAQRIAQLPEPPRSFNEGLLPQCGFEHIQAAIDAVGQPGTRILVLPGVYREEPSLAEPAGACAELAQRGGSLEYEEHVQCPHVQNLIAILGDSPDDADIACTTERLCGLQLEGTGAEPGDVLIDGAWHKLNAIRADRADGVYFRNFLVQRSEFNSLYVIQTDGFVIDRVVARWNYEYGFLTFAVDHGLYVDCEAYGNGDAGVYPGSASDLQGARPAVEITRCDAHHNMAGYSGTAGNSVFVHDNDFHHNAIGVVMDSVFPNHPGLPQDHGTFLDNRIFSNNENYYDNFLGPDAPCSKPLPEQGIEEGVVCPTSPVPVGTGIMVAGGNHNLFQGNFIRDNWRFGAMLFTVPALVREELDPAKQLDTSHFNRHLDNSMGLTPRGAYDRNGLDFWWDEGGEGNCWQDNKAGPAGIRSDPPGLPTCDAPSLGLPPNPAKSARLAPCALYDRDDNHHPAGCDWMDSPPEPNKPPEAAGSFEPAETDRLTPVRFTDRSTDPDGQVVAWLWEFGDGATSTERNPTHTYARLGTFTVTLTVTDDDGDPGSADIGKVKVKNIPPRARPGGEGPGSSAESVLEANRADPLQFQDQSEDPDGRVAAWSWDFGDGAGSAEQHPQHQYTELGDFTAQLTVTDDDGATGTGRATVRVVNLAPLAGFARDREVPMVLEVVQFSDLSADRDGSVAAWRWDFGDGAVSHERDPSHRFLAGGWHEVTLTVTDNEGAQARAAQRVFVCAPGADVQGLATLEHLRVQVEACVKLGGGLPRLL